MAVCTKGRGGVPNDSDGVSPAHHQIYLRISQTNNSTESKGPDATAEDEDLIGEVVLGAQGSTIEEEE